MWLVVVFVKFKAKNNFRPKARNTEKVPTVWVCPPSKPRVAEKRKGNDPSLLYSHADQAVSPWHCRTSHHDCGDAKYSTFYCGAVSPMQPGQTFVFSAFIIIVLVRVLMQWFDLVLGIRLEKGKIKSNINNDSHDSEIGLNLRFHRGVIYSNASESKLIGGGKQRVDRHDLNFIVQWPATSITQCHTSQFSTIYPRFRSSFGFVFKFKFQWMWMYYYHNPPKFT